MQNFTTLIVDMVKQEKLFASQGGNIILAQVSMNNSFSLLARCYIVRFFVFMYVLIIIKS